MKQGKGLDHFVEVIKVQNWNIFGVGLILLIYFYFILFILLFFFLGGGGGVDSRCWFQAYVLRKHDSTPAHHHGEMTQYFFLIYQFLILVEASCKNQYAVF